MRTLPLKTASFRYLETSFKEWLDILGYAPATVRAFPTYVREFFHYLEGQGKTTIKAIDIPVIKAYYQHLSQRANQRHGGGLSNNYLNSHLNALEKLLDYLRQQARILIPPTGIAREVPTPEAVVPLTTQEIHSLYRATEVYAEVTPLQSLRDKAILAVFYGCGLRRNEGVHLNLSDIHYEQRLVAVNHAKGSQPRFVPISKNTLLDLQNYQYEGRPHWAESGEDAFFVGYFGKRINGNTLNQRLKVMQQHSDIATLRHKPLHLHLLRHSIATHLLYQGMSLENVAQFLGHKSLESTQLYTHLMEQVYG